MFTVQGIYEKSRSCVRVCKGLSDEFEMKVSVDQGPVLSPLLIVIMLDALSREMGNFQLTGSRASLSAFTRKKGVALNRGNYNRGLKLTELSVKVIERIAYSHIRQVVTINWSTFEEPLCR